jgi:hypothetical protein
LVVVGTTQVVENLEEPLSAQGQIPRLDELRDDLYRLTKVLSGHFLKKMEAREGNATRNGGEQR